MEPLKKSRLKVILVVVSVIALTLVALFAYFVYSLPNFKPDSSVVVLHSKTHDDSLFLKKIVWGYLTHHYLFVISTSSEISTEPDQSKNYVFQHYEWLFYRFGADTLVVYVHKKAKEPTDMSTNISIDQVALSDSEMIDLRSHYKEYGLILVEEF